jgi:hypothetical protein
MSSKTYFTDPKHLVFVNHPVLNSSALRLGFCTPPTKPYLFAQ